MDGRRFRLEWSLKLATGVVAAATAAAVLARRGFLSMPGLALLFALSSSVCSPTCPSFAFCNFTARSLSTGLGTHSQQRNSSGTSPSMILKQAAWHQREQSSQAIEKPSSYEKPQMQLMSSERAMTGLFFLFHGINVEGNMLVGDSPRRPSAASAASWLLSFISKAQTLPRSSSRARPTLQRNRVIHCRILSAAAPHKPYRHVPWLPTIYIIVPMSCRPHCDE